MKCQPGVIYIEPLPSLLGNDFPVPIYGHAATNFGGSFIVGGGYGNGYYNEIYRWEQIDQSLKEAMNAANMKFQATKI